ncbi:hypothetical protein [uncultured Bacteroides sp.]|jgi:hypothetical protein|uniref:hypothetical protein n=1 Tax=uncultured Bacteroides sp. TaxID=162156 RepID=UPI00280BA76A|nr:hypothetical protein [uncultured Bacteroides sp.]
MLTNNILYQNFSQALTQAKNYQSQISQKEFEMKLIDINNRYSSNNYYYNELQKQKAELEILTLKNNRDSSIFSAIDYALELAQIEIKNNALYSMAYLAINSITSYLKIQKMADLILPYTLRLKLAQIDTALRYSNTSNAMLKSAISGFKNILHIF